MLDQDREVGLGDLDRDVRRGRARIRQPVVAVAVGRAPHVPTMSS